MSKIRFISYLFLLAIAGYLYFFPAPIYEVQGFFERGSIDSLFQHHIKTKYFVFHTNVENQELSDLYSKADLFIDTINKDFFEINYRFPIHSYIFSSQDEYNDFLHNHLHFNETGSLGMYVPKYQAFMAYKGSGWGTFVHEILHPLVDSSLPHAPKWAKEGIPTFAEKFFGYEQAGNLIISWGYQNPWRIDEIKDELTTLDLAAIMSNSNNESKLRLVSVFIYQNHKWKQFLELIKKNETNGYGTCLEAAFDMPLSQIEPLWRRYLNDILLNLDNISNIPPSSIFNSEREYSDFMYSQRLF